MMETLLECRLQDALASEAIVSPPLKIYFEEVSNNLSTPKPVCQSANYRKSVTEDYDYN